MNKDEILLKIKKLQKLTESSNDNESFNAKTLAEKLISKYNITEDDLKSIKDKQPLYGEKEKLYHSLMIVTWKNQLALGLARHFSCYIIQEESIPYDGPHEYDYYVYGDDEDVDAVKFAFHSFQNEIDNLIIQNCPNKGPVYIASYCEGVVQSIRSNLEIDGIDIPKVNREPLSKSDKVIENKTGLVGTAKETKEKPFEKSVDVNSHSLIRDIMAFLKGLRDGRNISLQDVVELEFQNIKNLIDS